MTKREPGLIIFGAGLAGLIAARMLADRHPTVMERQESLPNNHQALLRFRSSVVGEVTNIPFSKVQVEKHIISENSGNRIKDSAVYSRKVSGKLHSRSILDTTPVERYIAPPDFIQRLASTAKIEYGVDFLSWSCNLYRGRPPVISTIPIPMMMDLFKWPEKPNFVSESGWTIKAKINPELDCRMNSTIYSAVSHDPWYRASVTNDTFMVEGAAGGGITEHNARGILTEAASHFALALDDFTEWKSHQAKYQKIADLDTAGRESAKRFIMHLSSELGIYSLGRFATWRPKLLLDDLVKDVRVIAGLIDGKSHYEETLNR